MRAPSKQFNPEDYATPQSVADAKAYIGRVISVVIDRPLGSSHPDYPSMVYPINYGFVPNTLSGDGEELDCYVLGVDTPLSSYTGMCIAVIAREGEDDDKLVIAPDGQQFSDGEIESSTLFQERYFIHKIIRE